MTDKSTKEQAKDKILHEVHRLMQVKHGIINEKGERLKPGKIKFDRKLLKRSSQD